MRAAKQQLSPRATTADLSPVWEKLKVLSLVFSSLAVPIVLAVLGNSWSGAQKQNEIGVRYVELAAGILRAPPSTETRSLRLWAISVIDHYSQVPLPMSAKQELEQQRLDELTALMRQYQEQMQRQMRQQEEYMQRQRMQAGKQFQRQQSQTEEQRRQGDRRPQGSQAGPR